MDVDDAAAGEDVLELVVQQLVVAGAATDHHGLDVEVVQRIGHAVEEHAVVGDDLFGLVGLPRAALRVTAAQVAWRQHGLHARMPQHGLGGQANLAEEALAAATRKVEHRLGLGGGRARVADDGDVVLVLDIQQRTCGLLGQAAGHLLVDEVDHLLPQRRRAQRGRRRGGLLARGQREQPVHEALRPKAEADHARAHELDRARMGGVEEVHRRRLARAKTLLAHLAQQVAHVHGDIAEVDVHRARGFALVAHGAVVGHVLEVFPVLHADAAPGLLFVKEGLDQQRGGEDLVARAVQQVGARHVGGAHRLALAAAQAVLDAGADGADVALLHDERLVPHEPEAGRVGGAQVGGSRVGAVAAQQFALVEAPLGVDAPLVVGKGRQLRVAQEGEFGDADAVLARYHAAQAARQCHDARHRFVGRLQHGVVVAVDGDVGVHIAVTGMHVQGGPDAATQHVLVDTAAFVQQGRKGRTSEYRLQRLEDLRLPRRPQPPLLQQGKAGFAGGAVLAGLHDVEPVQPVLPQRAHLGQQGLRLLHAVFQQLGAGYLAGVVAAPQRQIAACKEVLQRLHQFELVAQAELDVDAFDALGVLAHARQRDDHVLVDLEGVGVLGNRGRALAVEPELLARVGADRGEALAGARIGYPHHLAGGAGDGVLVVANDVTQQHHLRQARTRERALALGGVAHGLEIAVVQVLQAREQDRAAALGILARAVQREQIVLDLDDARHRVLGVAEELQAHRAHVPRHAVHDPARAGDEAVAAFLLDAGQAGQELVGDVLAQALLAERAAGNVQPLAAFELPAAGVEVLQLEAGHLGVVDLAPVVVQARDLEPLRVGRDHAPTGQVVQRRAPEHGLLAAGVHGDVAADATGLGRSRVDGEDVAGLLGHIGHALGHDAGLAGDGGHGFGHARQGEQFHLAQGFELFGVDDRALPRQRHRAAVVAGAAATRDDGQPELDAALHQPGHLGLVVWREHDEGVFHAPVGGVGDMRDARQAVELQVVARGTPAEHAAGRLAQVPHGTELRREGFHRGPRGGQQFTHQRVALHVGGRVAAPGHLVQAVVQRLDEQGAALGVVEQVVFEVGIALHHPDVAQHLVEHARAAAGAALLAQPVQNLPTARAQQADHDLAVAERGVVVGDLAQARRQAGGGAGKHDRGQRQRCVHRVTSDANAGPTPHWQAGTSRGGLSPVARPAHP